MDEFYMAMYVPDMLWEIKTVKQRAQHSEHKAARALEVLDRLFTTDVTHMRQGREVRACLNVSEWEWNHIRNKETFTTKIADQLMAHLYRSFRR